MFSTQRELERDLRQRLAARGPISEPDDRGAQRDRILGFIGAILLLMALGLSALVMQGAGE